MTLDLDVPLIEDQLGHKLSPSMIYELGRAQDQSETLGAVEHRLRSWSHESCWEVRYNNGKLVNLDGRVVFWERKEPLP